MHAPTNMKGRKIRISDIPPANIEIISDRDASRDVMYNTEINMKIGLNVLINVGMKLT